MGQAKSISTDNSFTDQFAAYLELCKPRVRCVDGIHSLGGYAARATGSLALECADLWLNRYCADGSVCRRDQSYC